MLRISRIPARTATLLPFMLVLCASAHAAVPVFSPPCDSQRDKAREVIVKFQRGVIERPTGTWGCSLNDVEITVPQIMEVLQNRGVESIRKAFPDFDPENAYMLTRKGDLVRKTDVSNVYITVVADPESVAPLVDELSDLDCVSYAAPNRVKIRLHYTPNDPLYPQQWSLNNDGQTGGAADADVDAQEAWEITRGVPGVKIGIIDNGIDWDHIELANKVGGDPDTSSWIEFGHGTKVAGIAAATGDNSEGIAGVNWHARLHSETLYPEPGLEEIYNAVHSAINAGCSITNSSWGVDYTDMLIRAAYDDAYRANLLSVAAVGDNDSDLILYPAAWIKTVMAVSATDHLDDRWADSNYGEEVNVAAPGCLMPTTAPGGGYITETGTSYAAPVVAGIASLLLSEDPDLDNDDLERIIELTAEDVNSDLLPGWDQEIGYGRVNADSALQRLRPPWQLYHFETGGSVYATEDLIMRFLNHPELEDALYIAKKYDIRTTVALPGGFSQAPDFWARRVSSRGYSDANPNIGGLPWAHMFGFDGANVTLQTFVYYLRTFPGGQPVGWYPTDPANALLAYTVLGPLETTGVDSPKEPDRGRISLRCHPNPTAAGTTVHFYLEEAAQARVAVYDVAGRLVHVLWDGVAGSGANTVRWNGKTACGTDVASGVYLVTFESRGTCSTDRITVAR